MQKFFTSILWPETICPSSSFSSGSHALKGEIVTIEQVQLDIEVRVQLWVGIGTEIPLLITACENSGFLGMVTLKSLGGVFAV